MTEEDIVKNIISRLMSNMKTSFPYYRSDIHTEHQANKAQDLPLVYIWGETVDANGNSGFSLSVNGNIVGRMLEEYIPRSHTEFADIRDHIMGLISRMQRDVVISMCQQFKCTPRQIAEGLPR